MTAEDGRQAEQAAPGAAVAERQSVLRRLRERVSLPGLEAWSTSTRTVFLNALFLLMVLVVFPVLVSQFRRDEVVIEPIAVPEALELQGLTPNVAASRVWDGLQDVVARAATAKETIAAIPDSRRVEFSFPDSGFSIESLVYHVRKLFNAYETRIGGEFTCAEPTCERAGMRLRLRVVRDRVDLVEMPPLGERSEREYFAEAAAKVLGHLDPFVAIAASADTQPTSATTLARRLIRAHHPDAKWAHNLVGLIRMRERDLVSARREFEAALELDDSFLPARSNLGNAALLSKDLAGAERAFEAALSLDRDYVPAIDGMAELALAKGDRVGAVALLERAADAAPLDPLFLSKAGRIEVDAGRRKEGEALLRRALELDPGYLPAFATLAAVHLTEGDYAAAEKLYRDAADYAPDDAEAQASHGRLLAIRKDWPGAVARYSRAAELEPAEPDHLIEQAKCLQRLGRHEEALAALERAEELDPTNAEVFLAQGDSLRDTDRKPEAVAAYKRFLELDKEGSVMRPIAERFIELLSS